MHHVLGGVAAKIDLLQFSSVQFSCSVVFDSLRPHESQHARPPCLPPTPGVYSNSCPSIGDAIQPSHPLSSTSPPAPNPSQHQGLISLHQLNNSPSLSGGDQLRRSLRRGRNGSEMLRKVSVTNSLDKPFSVDSPTVEGHILMKRRWPTLDSKRGASEVRQAEFEFQICR